MKSVVTPIVAVHEELHPATAFGVLGVETWNPRLSFISKCDGNVSTTFSWVYPTPGHTFSIKKRAHVPECNEIETTQVMALTHRDGVTGH